MENVNNQSIFSFNTLAVLNPFSAVKGIFNYLWPSKPEQVPTDSEMKYIDVTFQVETTKTPEAQEVKGFIQRLSSFIWKPETTALEKQKVEEVFTFIGEQNEVLSLWFDQNKEQLGEILGAFFSGETLTFVNFENFIDTVNTYPNISIDRNSENLLDEIGSAVAKMIKKGEGFELQRIKGEEKNCSTVLGKNFYRKETTRINEMQNNRSLMTIKYQQKMLEIFFNRESSN